MGNKLLIVASKRYGDYVKEIAESMGCFETISFVDNDREDAIGRLDELSRFYLEYNCAIAACDDGEERLMWNKKLEELFHKDSTISPSSSLLPGSIVEPRAVIGCQTTIGSSTVIGAGTVIEPYCFIGDGSTLRSGTIVKSTSIVDAHTVTNQGTVLYVEDKKGE